MFLIYWITALFWDSRVVHVHFVGSTPPAALLDVVFILTSCVRMGVHDDGLSPPNRGPVNRVLANNRLQGLPAGFLDKNTVLQELCEWFQLMLLSV